jgi:hypothetical protein
VLISCSILEFARKVKDTHESLKYLFSELRFELGTARYQVAKSRVTRLRDALSRSRGLILGKCKIFSVQAGTEPHETIYVMGNWRTFSEVKWSQSEADHSPPSFNVKDPWNYTSTHPIRLRVVALD